MSSYLLSGDAFLVERKQQALLQEIRKKIKGEAPLQTFHLGENPLGEVLTQACSLPFLAAAQIFRCVDADRLKEKDLELLAEYFEHPSPSTFLIFEAVEMEKTNKFALLLAKHGEVFFLEGDKQNPAANRWLHEKINRSGKRIAPPVLRRLEEQAALAPSFMNSVLDQLLLYAANKDEITDEMVDLFEEKWQETNVYHLTDAIAGRKMQTALTLMKRVLEEGDQDVIALTGLLHWQIKRLWLGRVLLEEGAPESILLKKCKISPRQAPFFMRQIKASSRKNLEAALEGLFQLDWKAKTGRVEPAVGLEAWLVKTTAG